MAGKGGKILKFTWKLENYSYLWNKKDEFVLSPDFEMDVFEGSSWCLKLYPGGVSSYEKYISVHLERLESSKGPLGITLNYEISLLRPDGTAEYVMETKNRCFRKGRAFGFDNLAIREEIFGAKKSILLPDDMLTVQCRLSPNETELKSNTEIIAKTHIELERSVFTWKCVNNFSDMSYEYNRINVLNKKKRPGLKLIKGNFVNFFIFDNPNVIKVIRCKVGILDSNKSVSRLLIDKQIYNTGSYLNIISRDEILKQKSLYLPNDKLTLYCDFTFSFGVLHSKIEMASCDNAFAFVTAGVKEPSEIWTSPKNHSCSCADNDASFKSDFQNLYQEGTLCDFMLKVENENIHAHKVVLGARSPVFKAMFRSNMKENEKHLVDISDLDAKTVRRMLSFMYTDTTNDLDWESACKLYFAADKYEIIKLKSICSNVLERNLGVSNVAKALSLANMHGDEDLKNITLDFICRHDTEVICSTEWKAFMTEEVNLAAETMRCIFMKKAGNNGGKT